MKMYGNLPVPVRCEVIAVMPKEGPITWNVAYLEIDNDTELGKKILQKLAELNII